VSPRHPWPPVSLQESGYDAPPQSYTVDPADYNSSAPWLSVAMFESRTSSESVSGSISCERAPGQPSTISGMIPQGAIINVPLYKLSSSYRAGDSTISRSATESTTLAPGQRQRSPQFSSRGHISWDPDLTDWGVRFVTSPPDQVNPTVLKRLGYNIKSVHKAWTSGSRGAPVGQRGRPGAGWLLLARTGDSWFPNASTPPPSGIEHGQMYRRSSIRYHSL
jgi:hypothetical protein